MGHQKLRQADLFEKQECPAVANDFSKTVAPESGSLKIVFKGARSFLGLTRSVPTIVDRFSTFLIPLISDVIKTPSLSNNISFEDSGRVRSYHDVVRDLREITLGEIDNLIQQQQSKNIFLVDIGGKVAGHDYAYARPIAKDTPGHMAVHVHIPPNTQIETGRYIVLANHVCIEKDHGIPTLKIYCEDDFYPQKLSNSISALPLRAFDFHVA